MDPEEVVVNTEKLVQLKALEDLYDNGKGTLKKKDYTEMKALVDAMPNTCKRSALPGVQGSGGKVSVEDESTAREREVRNNAVKWIKTVEEPAMCGQLYQALYVKKQFTDDVVAKQMVELCHGNAANRAIYELFEPLGDGETPPCLKKDSNELPERQIARVAVYEWLRQLAAVFGAGEIIEKHPAEEENREDIRAFIYKAFESDADRRLVDGLYRQWKKQGDVKPAKREREGDDKEGPPKDKSPNWTDGWKPECQWCKDKGHWESKCPAKKAGKPKKK